MEVQHYATYGELRGAEAPVSREQRAHELRHYHSYRLRQVLPAF